MLRLVGATIVLLFAGAASRLIIKAVRRTFMRRLTMREYPGASGLERVKRQQTVLTLLESLIRYAVFTATVIVAALLLFQGAASAVFGASLLVVLTGFGIRQLLGDVVAGGLLVFENQYAVGDVLTITTPALTGVVEEFSLRSTTLRTFTGDRVVLLNGSLTAFTVVKGGVERISGVIAVGGTRPATGELEQYAEWIRESVGSAILDGPAFEAVDSAEGCGLVRFTAAIVPGTGDIVQRAAQDALPSFGDRDTVSVQVYPAVDVPLVLSHQQAVVSQ